MKAQSQAVGKILVSACCFSVLCGHSIASKVEVREQSQAVGEILSECCFTLLCGHCIAGKV